MDAQMELRILWRIVGITLNNIRIVLEAPLLIVTISMIKYDAILFFPHFSNYLNMQNNHTRTSLQLYQYQPNQETHSGQYSHVRSSNTSEKK